MGQSVIVFERQISTGTAAGSSGTFAPTLDTSLAKFSNKMVTVHVECRASIASGGNMTGGARLHADYVVENKAGTVTAPAAISGSNNPANDSTTTFVASKAQAADAGVWSGSPPTLAMSIVGNKIVATFTNTASSTVNVTMIFDYDFVGST